MPGLTLWQIDAHYVLLLNQLEENDGELNPELEKELDSTIAELVGKQDNYIRMMDTLDTLEEQAKQWRDRMNNKIRRFQDQKERLKEGLRHHLHVIGQTELIGELGKVKLMTSAKVGEINLDDLPEKYK